METGLTEQHHVNRLKGEALGQSTSRPCKEIFIFICIQNHLLIFEITFTEQYESAEFECFL